MQVAVVGITGMHLCEDEQNKLVSLVSQGLAKVCSVDEKEIFVSLVPPLKDDFHGETMIERITYIAYVPEAFSSELKERIIQRVYDDTVDATGFRGDYKVVMFIETYKPADLGIGKQLMEDGTEEVK